MNPRKIMAAYGTWASPLTAAVVAAGSVRLESVALDGEDLYWIEGRPADGGRNTLVSRRPDGQVVDVTPSGTNVRSRVHEYGGGAFLVCDRTVYFSEFADQRVYRLDSRQPRRSRAAHAFVRRAVLRRLVCSSFTAVARMRP